MMQNAVPARVEASRAFGAEVVLAENVHEAFALAERIEAEEGRTFVTVFGIGSRRSSPAMPSHSGCATC